jgi:hypothetical protein
MADPEIALNRSREPWNKHGRSAKWIERRILGRETRNKLTDYWKERDVKEGVERAVLTNIIHEEWAGFSVKVRKSPKDLKTHNSRDHMSEAEFIFTSLAELSTRQIAESMDATGFDANKEAGEKGGGAKKARGSWKKRLEARSPRSVWAKAI